MINFYKYMVYASEYLTIRDILETRKINNYEKLPLEIKEKIPLSYSIWARNNGLKKKITFKGKLGD